MKFVLREYLRMLKEDQELDKLLSDLLFNMGVVPLTKPQKGRQHGVDIAAAGIDPEDRKKKLFLLVVKQGDLSRSAWDSGINAVRPTLNEVLDVYIKTAVPTRFARLPKKIIVCCNGELNQNVNPNWTAFTRQHSKRNRLEFDFWGIDQIVHLLDRYSISENVLPEKEKILLRKTLAFLDLREYDLNHFYQLISNILEEKRTPSKRKRIKTLRVVALCLNMVYKWSLEINNLRPSFIAAERTVLSSWDWLRRHDLFADRNTMLEFYTIHQIKLLIGRDYFRKIQSHCYVKDSLYPYGRIHVEYALLTWENIGIISTIGLSELFESHLHSESAFGSKEQAAISLKNAEAIARGLYNLIANNPAARSPKYDEHLIELTLALILLKQTKHEEKASQWINQISISLVEGYKLLKFFPLFHTNYDNLVEIDQGISKAELTSSYFITMLAEWACLLNDENLYHFIFKMSTNIFKDVDLQIWFPGGDTENFYYTKNATSETGSTKHSLMLPEDFTTYRKEMRDEVLKFCAEKDMSMITKGFFYLAYVVSRHHRTYLPPLYWRGLLEL